MIVGLTGGIGTGKSTVARIFETIGVPVYCSDIRAKAMYYDSSVKEKVIELLGSEAYKSNGELNREFISKSIFSNATLLHKINSIIHPAVESDFKNFLENNNKEKFIVKGNCFAF